MSEIVKQLKLIMVLLYLVLPLAVQMTVRNYTINYFVFYKIDFIAFISAVCIIIYFIK